ncbi:MAG: nickel-binding protein [Dehalococcoidia bacterium]
MALYRIQRNLGEKSQAEIDAAALRAIVCAPQFPGVKWHRSFWDEDAGRLDCFYEANSIADLEEHSRVSRIPCDEVSEVTEILPETYVHG